MSKQKLMSAPRWLTAHFGCCHECGRSLKGRLVLWWPRMRWAFCEACGRRVLAAIEDREAEGVA